ncbi:uncharacterized protein [Haliotis asinina]|uniref:uncharacterized protein n=1 Tax=Haliotis asinina TaxID=109174 RepID=UPI0035321DFF
MGEYIPEESFERFRNCLIAQLCDNKEIASEIELHVAQIDVRKRYSSAGNDTEGVGPGSNPEAKTELLKRLVHEVKDSLDQIVFAATKAEKLTASRDSAISSNSYRSSTSAGALHLTEVLPEQDHEPHNPPTSLVQDRELWERLDAAVQTSRRALRETQHQRLHVLAEQDDEEQTELKEKLESDRR